MKPQLFSGARGKVTFKSPSGEMKILGFITDVSVSENEGLRPSFVVGSMGPVTIEPLSYDVSVSVGRIMPINKPDGSPMDKYTAIDHEFEASINAILALESCEIILEDKNPADPTNPKIIAAIKYCRFAGRSQSLSSGDVASERYNFVGIYDGGRGGDTNTAEINYGLE
jgi:hypothetical protein